MSTLTGITSYFKGVVAETRKVTWPTWNTLASAFVSVVVGVALATAVIGTFDYLFLHLLGFIVK